MENKYIKCPICEWYHWTNESCGDPYTIHHEDFLGEKGKVVYGDGFEDAAEKYAKYIDDDNTLLEEGPFEIEVTKGGVTKRIRISAEPSVEYYANEIRS